MGEVRPWPLEDYLEIKVPAKLRELGVAIQISQDPEAEITSRPGTWLARTTGEAAAQTRSTPITPESADAAAAPAPQTVSRWFAPRASRAFLDLALETSTRGEAAERGNFPAALQTEAQELSQSYAQPPRNLACGFVVHGTTFKEAYQQDAEPGLNPSSVEVNTAKPVPVVLRFADDSGLILPALPHFVAHLTVDPHGVRDVAYEPVPGTNRWFEYTGRMEKLRTLRGEVAVATRHGVFRPTGAGCRRTRPADANRQGAGPYPGNLRRLCVLHPPGGGAYP